MGSGVYTRKVYMHECTSLSPFWDLANGKFEFNNNVWDVGAVRHFARNCSDMLPRHLLEILILFSHVIRFPFLSQLWIATLG